MEHPKAIGDRTMLAVMLAFQSRGTPFLIPFGENTRYDLVIEEGARLARVQCKTGRLRDGAIRFATCSAYGHHRNPQRARRDYQGEVDYFAVYCPETTGVYLVPITVLPTKNQASLRLAPARNNQARRIRFAADYEMACVVAKPRVSPKLSSEPNRVAASGAR